LQRRIVDKRSCNYWATRTSFSRVHPSGIQFSNHAGTAPWIPFHPVIETDFIVIITFLRRGAISRKARERRECGLLSRSLTAFAVSAELFAGNKAKTEIARTCRSTLPRPRRCFRPHAPVRHLHQPGVMLLFASLRSAESNVCG